MLELARGIKRVAIDDDITGPQGAEQGDRILQKVRHHQRDARPARQARDILKKGAEVLGQRVQLGIGQGDAHADEGGMTGEATDGVLENIDEGRKGAHVDVRIDARGILRKPYSLHDAPPNFLIVVNALLNGTLSPRRGASAMTRVNRRLRLARGGDRP